MPLSLIPMFDLYNISNGKLSFPINTLYFFYLNFLIKIDILFKIQNTSNLVTKKSGLNAFPSGEKKIVKESQWYEILPYMGSL